YFVQTLVLSIIGGFAGIWFARACAALLLRLGHIDNGNGVANSFDAPALGIHSIAVLAAVLLIGIFPALHAARIDLAAGLAESASTHSASKSQAFLRRVLAALQIAV